MASLILGKYVKIEGKVENPSVKQLMINTYNTFSFHSPIVFHCAGFVCRPMISTGVASMEIFTFVPVFVSLLDAVKKEFGKGNVQYSGTRGSQAPRPLAVGKTMIKDRDI